MKRAIGGALLAAVALIAMAAGGDVKPGLFWFAVGVTLCVFGFRAVIRQRKVALLALQSLRSTKTVQAALIAQKMNMDEITVRQMISGAQREGIVPLNAEIV